MLSGKFQTKSAWDFSKSEQTINLKGKSVIFGDTSVPARDHSITPIDIRMFNPLIYVIAMSNLLNNEFITPISSFTLFLIFVVLLVAIMMLAVNVDVFRFGLLSIGLLIIYITINLMIFVYYSIHLPMLIILLPLISAVAYLMIHCIYASQVKIGVTIIWI